MKNHFVLASGNITIGDHRSVCMWPACTIYGDVVWTTLLAAAIVMAFGLRMRAKATSGVPGKLQLLWELLTEQVTDLASSAIGPEGLPFVGIGVTIGLLHPGLQLAGLHSQRRSRLPGRRPPATSTFPSPWPYRLRHGALQLGQGAGHQEATSSTTPSPTPP